MQIKISFLGYLERMAAEPEKLNAYKQLYLPKYGGIEGIEALQAKAKSLTATNCPFCGGEAAITINESFNCLVTRICCTNCKAGTRQYNSGRQSIISAKELTIEDCIINAFNDWQRRI